MSGNRAAKREFNPISLSFLDVMSCGFGAVVLIFLILDHSTSVQTQASDPELMAEINLLNDEINDGEANLVRIRNTISDVDYDMVEAQGLARSIQQEIDDELPDDIRPAYRVVMHKFTQLFEPASSDDEQQGN